MLSYASSSSAINVILGYSGMQASGDAQGDYIYNVENLAGTNFNDVITGSSAVNIMDGGAGRDMVGYSFSTAAVNVNLNVAVQSGGHAAGDTLIDIEDAYGTDYNDVLTGNELANYLIGANGNDTITGGAGNDTLDGRAGTDSFIFGVGFGTDTIMGFEGEGSSGGDVITFATAVFANFAAVQAATTYNSGTSEATINAGSGNQILVQGVTQSFVSGDFAFV